MKKLISAVLAIVLIVSLSAPAYAVSAKYTNTKDFIEMLDENDFTYTIEGIDKETRCEEVVIPMAGDDIDYDLHFFFDEEEDVISVRLWCLIYFDEEDFLDVLYAVNQLNDAYKFVKFVLDESDYSITVSMDAVVREGCEIGEIGYDCMYYMVMISDDAYAEVLSEFAIDG